MRLDIRETPNGSLVIKRYPFETVFDKEEIVELQEYFHDREFNESLHRINARLDKYMEMCEKKFQMENPCPKCCSHNVDIDLGTPIFCKDCKYEW